MQCTLYILILRSCNCNRDRNVLLCIETFVGGLQSEDAYKVGDFAGAVTMLVEAQDEGHFAKILVAEGERVDVGTPVGLMCEDAEDLALIQGFQGRIPSGQGVDGTRTLTWQAYLKSGTGRGEGCL